MTIIIILVIGTVALGWWLFANRPAPVEEEELEITNVYPDQPWPGYEDLFEGPVYLTDHAENDSMPARAITDTDIRSVLANPEAKVTYNDPTEERPRPSWTVMARTPTDGRQICVVVDQWPSDHPRIVTVFAKNYRTTVRVPTGRLTWVKRALPNIEKQNGTRIVVGDRVIGTTPLHLQSPVKEWMDDATENVLDIGYPERDGDHKP
jgi:hypothetical protein